MSNEQTSSVERDVALLRAADALLGVDFLPPRERALLRAGERVATSATTSTTSATSPTSAASATASATTPTLATMSPTPAAPPAQASLRAETSARPAPAVIASSSSDPQRERLLEALRIEHDERCPHCTTSTAHTRTVFGEGSASAALMFVGEAPGETEDQLGRPFVGRAGQKLDEIIAAMGLARGDVYIANVLKSRPPGNRTPLQHEVDACGPYLKRQIALIRPRVIVTLGGPATKLMLNVEQGITRLRGVWAEYRDGDLVVPVMPTFHPAYLLRNYTMETRKQVWSDMQQVVRQLR